jgi:hypothetical protein
MQISQETGIGITQEIETVGCEFCKQIEKVHLINLEMISGRIR